MRKNSFLAVKEPDTIGRMNAPWFEPDLGSRAIELVSEAVASNFPNDGVYTDRFERALAAFLGVPHVIAVTSGTAAIFLSLKACGIGPGDEVIVPDLTFIATANAVVMAGATVVLVDVRGDDLTMDVQAVESAIGPRTKAIIPVHVNGRSADMTGLGELARSRGLRIIEDAAEALGSRVGGQALGTIGDAGCFSFAPSKVVTTGQGGIIATRDADLAVRVRELKDHGRRVRGTGGADDHPVVGFNFKFSNILAALGLAQLEVLPDRLEHICSLHRQYVAELEGVAEVRVLPVDLAGGQVPLWVDSFVDDRAGLVAALAGKGMGTREFWHPLHTQKPYQVDREFPQATSISARGLWLPSAPKLTSATVSDVTGAIREYYRGGRA